MGRPQGLMACCARNKIIQTGKMNPETRYSNTEILRLAALRIASGASVRKGYSKWLYDNDYRIDEQVAKQYNSLTTSTGKVKAEHIATLAAMQLTAGPVLRGFARMTLEYIGSRGTLTAAQLKTIRWWKNIQNHK